MIYIWIQFVCNNLDDDYCFLFSMSILLPSDTEHMMIQLSVCYYVTY